MPKENQFPVQALNCMAMQCKRFVFACICAILFSVVTVDGLFFCPESNAADHVVNTRYARLVFQTPEDVRKFNSEIDFSIGSGFGNIFSTKNEREVEKELIAKVDALFVKVQRILDMRKKMKKVRVNVYSDTEQLHKAYYRLYKKECKLRGWYLYKRHTVYLNVQDVQEGMLAHEFAHAIIDHFLTVRPPRASAEILARYVDKHLFEEVPQY